MEINIQSVNFENSESLNAYVTKKVSKLGRFGDVGTAEVALRILNTSDKSNREISIRLQAGGQEFFASRKAEAFEEAVVQSVEILERQLVKAKEKKQ